MNKQQQKLIYNILSERVHGKEFYNATIFQELVQTIDQIVKDLDLMNGTPSSKIERVNKYLIDNVNVRGQYFEAFREIVPEIPQSELIYRTAYAALVKKEAMCAGFTEAARMLLEISGLETRTLLSKLPGKNKRLLHYVTAIKYDRGSGRDYYIMDPERERSCNEKGYDFRRYLLEMLYIQPEEYFYEHKVGKSGVGPTADEYLSMGLAKCALGKNNVDLLFNKNILKEKNWWELILSYPNPNQLNKY